MHKVIIGVLFAACVATAAYAKHKQTITIEIINGTTSLFSNNGVESPLNIAGSRTKIEQQSIRAIINGQHVLLDCKEHHHGCLTLAPGKYSGEMSTDTLDPDKPVVNIWVMTPIPLTTKTERDHYSVSGSW